MFDAEDLKACDKKERIAGQTDQRRNWVIRRRGKAIDAVLHPVTGNRSIDQRVASDAACMSDKPETQHKASRKSERGVDACSALSSGHVFASYWVQDRLCIRSKTCVDSDL